MNSQTLTNLVRLILPRSFRNALRRPRVTLSRAIAKAEFGLGHYKNLLVRQDWNLRCHPMCVSEFSVFQTDPPQRAELEEFVTQCRPGMRFLDVGAHWGIFTLAALRYGGSEVRAICVEPSPLAARVLRWNLSLNSAGDRVKAIEVAAGAAPGYLQMLTTGAGGADYLVVPTGPRPDSVSVPQADLTGLCHSLKFLPTHVKMDIEGFEEEGLLGAREILQRYRPVLFLELHGDLIRRRGCEPRAVLRILTEAGYHRWNEAGKVVNEHYLERQRFNARLVCFPDAGTVP